MIKSVAIALVPVLLLAGCGEEPEQWHFDGAEISAEDAPVVTRALEIFVAACPDLFKRYWSDVIEAKVSIMDNFPDEVMVLPYYQRYGWRKNVLLKVSLPIDLKSIPHRYHAYGHTLFYYLGGGRMPGIMAGKVQSQMVCGFEPNGRTDLHVPAPALAVVDELS